MDASSDIIDFSLPIWVTSKLSSPGHNIDVANSLMFLCESDHCFFFGHPKNPLHDLSIANSALIDTLSTTLSTGGKDDQFTILSVV
jgi:hypothetical protein